ncbi:hypothetical protein GCM10010441_19690 [Kitasatospora paracochleata]|uniref:Integral membrane protein n=1 Tax=Kitasatospora paracochleata TaxID=58354 RepID=A0ABT1J3F4_9ACTN|nr:DUF6629 family protein [Kitasatospora paracochleata]MCP2311898.1 hypothetical protein [Kitasatospora paracochleata]
MCWSAQADTVAGVVVGAIGIACLASVTSVRQLPLAALPLLLGVHQLLEAAVWSGAAWARTPWAVVALPLLPVWVPGGVWAATGRRRAAAFTVVGLAVAVPLTVAVAAQRIGVHPQGHTLGYAIGVPFAPLLLAGYLLATVGALVSSGDRGLRLLGWLVGVGAVVCGLLWRLAFVSTWCALAAVASVVLLWWVRGGSAAPVMGGRPTGG